jgi:hypothetical protein
MVKSIYYEVLDVRFDALTTMIQIVALRVMMVCSDVGYPVNE